MADNPLYKFAVKKLTEEPKKTMGSSVALTNVSYAALL
jgi:hypothetical protein